MAYSETLGGSSFFDPSSSGNSSSSSSSSTKGRWDIESASSSRSSSSSSTSSSTDRWRGYRTFSFWSQYEKKNNDSQNGCPREKTLYSVLFILVIGWSFGLYFATKDWKEYSGNDFNSYLINCPHDNCPTVPIDQFSSLPTCAEAQQSKSVGECIFNERQCCRSGVSNCLVESDFQICRVNQKHEERSNTKFGKGIFVFFILSFLMLTLAICSYIPFYKYKLYENKWLSYYHCFLPLSVIVIMVLYLIFI